MKQRLFAAGMVALALMVGLFVVGCEDDDDDDDAQTTTTVPGSDDTTPELVAPTQTSPANGASLNHFPRTTTLVWSSVSGAASYGVEVQINTGSWQPLATGEVDNPTYTFTFTGMNTGRWRVWAIDDAGDAGPKSGWYEFTYTI